MHAALRKEELIKLVRLSFYTIDKQGKDGDFPKRFSLTPRVVAWNRDEVEAWPDARQKYPDLIERDAGMMKGLEKT
ncbi:AlpA family transcriptional regulator [Klebsiella sp. H-Nf2]|uniref:helix-turn-helix transcriptional regulator n=3 Tax=Klebsiella TaxID=570 RepID=UPI000C28706E|nr:MULTISPECIES: AlpA family phage regulatory protein [unclassified Klebsiella]PJR51835.1 AlpA family transcriptional regulator [Klebsiella sp. H-Nf2]PJX43491.1 AlpA family transcriptional regulator [Klebsiella sp. C-Nf10]PJX54557.1 AlpA family transcriptional regulator [Klebsiella sp. D-Nf1]